MTKKKCTFCDRTLPVFGSDRLNGKESYPDWNGRAYHKKCYRENLLQLKILEYELKSVQNLPLSDKKPFDY